MKDWKGCVCVCVLGTITSRSASSSLLSPVDSPLLKLRYCSTRHVTAPLSLAPPSSSFVSLYLDTVTCVSFWI